MSYPIFIAPLSRHFTSAELAALFRPFGRVVLAKVIYDCGAVSAIWTGADGDRRGRGQCMPTPRQDHLSEGYPCRYEGA